MRGRPAVYATFSSYDEVAHHSGLSAPTRSRRCASSTSSSAASSARGAYAPRPYEIVVLSDHGQTQGATFKQRNGYGLDELVERSLARGGVAGIAGGDEQHAMVGHAVDEATGRKREQDAPKNDVSDRDVVVLGSGNLGLVYLMEEQAPADARGDRRAPSRSCSRRCASTRTSAGCSSARRSTARSRSAPRGAHYLDEGRVEGEDPLAPFSPTAAQHLRRTDGFAHVADIMVGSFYDPVLDEGCAFEELISFHGGLGGPQTRAVHPEPESPAGTGPPDPRRGGGP